MVSNSYVVCFEGNSSNKWDRKEAYINVEVLDKLYSKEELVHGAEVTVLWKSKRKSQSLEGDLNHHLQTNAQTQPPGKFPDSYIWYTIWAKYLQTKILNFRNFNSYTIEANTYGLPPLQIY